MTREWTNWSANFSRSSFRVPRTGRPAGPVEKSATNAPYGAAERSSQARHTSKLTSLFSNFLTVMDVEYFGFHNFQIHNISLDDTSNASN